MQTATPPGMSSGPGAAAASAALSPLQGVRCRPRDCSETSAPMPEQLAAHGRSQLRYLFCWRGAADKASNENVLTVFGLGLGRAPFLSPRCGLKRARCFRARTAGQFGVAFRGPVRGPKGGPVLGPSSRPEAGPASTNGWRLRLVPADLRRLPLAAGLRKYSCAGTLCPSSRRPPP